MCQCFVVVGALTLLLAGQPASAAGRKEASSHAPGLLRSAVESERGLLEWRFRGRKLPVRAPFADRSVGAGGMGEEFRARDTKLNRDVAAKVLPEDFAADESRLRRFHQEAKTPAALNSPPMPSS